MTPWLKKHGRGEWFRALITVLVIGLGAAPWLPEGTEAQTADSVAKRIEKEKLELDRLRMRIADQQRKSQSAARRENSILTGLEEVDHQRAIKKKELAVINLQLIERDQQIQTLSVEIDSLRKEIEDKEDRVRARVRVLYQEGRVGSTRALFAAEGYYDLLKRFYYLSWVSKKESELLESYQAAVADFTSKETALRNARSDLVLYKTATQRKLNEIQGEKRKKDRLLAGVRKERATYEQAVKELEDSTSRLKGLIEELERQRKARREREVLTGFTRQRGFLDWPTEGRVVTLFGRQKHPTFDTEVFRKGIEIQAAQGQPIRSVFDGTVVFADWLRGYGLLVILDHGEDYYSLYAHAGRLVVAPGDRVGGRQVIGEIGDTGLTEDSNLYFEIRRGADPQNPLAWLKKR